MSDRIDENNAQGLYSLRRIRHRSALPTMGGEPDSPEIRPTIFGQGQVVTLEGPFEDVPRIDPASRLGDAGGLLSSEDTNQVPTTSLKMNGVFEPLTVRRSLRRGLWSAREGHDVLGAVLDGPNDVRGRSVSISSDFPVSGVSTTPYVDRGSYLGSSQAVSVWATSEVDTPPRVDRPFSDRISVSDQLHGVTITETNIISALTDMRSDGEDLVRRGSRSAGTGFTYDGCVPGVDSLAFGGLLR